jgi:hypothetical protein
MDHDDSVSLQDLVHDPIGAAPSRTESFKLAMQRTTDPMRFDE